MLLERVADEYRRGNLIPITFYKFDIDQLAEIGDFYKARALPFSVFLNESSDVVATFSGIDIEQFLIRANILIKKDNVAASEISDAAHPIQPVIPHLTMLTLHREFAKSEFPQKETLSQYGMFSDALSFQFLHDVGLGHVPFRADDMANLNSAVAESFALAGPASGYTSASLVNLYSFPQPTVSADGTCSNLLEMAEKAFNLATDAYGIGDIELRDTHTGATASSPESASELDVITINGRLYNGLKLADYPSTLRLFRLQALVSRLHGLTKADWIGIYRMSLAQDVLEQPVAASDLGSATKSGIAITDAPVPRLGEPYPVLLKESYFGEPSRAVFPVTEAFCIKSTNSWVGHTGKARLIPNTNSRGGGVSYYKCSGSVQSELCVPILQLVRNRGDSLSQQQQQHYQVVGIIDLESWNLDHFTPRMIVEVLKVALDLGSIGFGTYEEESPLKESGSTASWELASGNGDHHA